MTSRRGFDVTYEIRSLSSKWRPWMPVARDPMCPPSFRSRTVFVGVFFSSSPNFEMILSLSPWNFCGQWHCSHVARAGRRVCTGDGIGREYVPNAVSYTHLTLP